VVLTKLGNKIELLHAFYNAGLQSWYAAMVSEQEEKRKELSRKSLLFK